MLLYLSWWYNFFEAGIKYFMVQYNVSGRYTFIKKLLLLRVEETESSLFFVPFLTPLAWNSILHVVIICSHVALLWPGISHHRCGSASGSNEGVPGDDNRMGRSCYLHYLVLSVEIIRSWWSKCCCIKPSSDSEQTDDMRRLLVHKVLDWLGCLLLNEKTWF